MNRNSQTVHLTPAFLGQSFFFFFTVNVCCDFQGLFSISSFQLVLKPGRTQLSATENHEAVAVGKPNSPDMSTYQVSLPVHFREWQLEETRKAFVLFCQTHFKEHYTQPAYSLVWLKKMFPLLLQLHRNGKTLRVPNPPATFTTPKTSSLDLCTFFSLE